MVSGLSSFIFVKGVLDLFFFCCCFVAVVCCLFVLHPVFFFVVVFAKCFGFEWKRVK